MIPGSERIDNARFVASRLGTNGDIDQDRSRGSLRSCSENARRSFQDIGEQVSPQRPAVKRRVDRLEEDGVDHAATAPPSIPTKFGWHSHAFVGLYCEGRMAGGEILAAVQSHPEVGRRLHGAGEASAILHIRAEDTKHLEEALERIRDVNGRAAHRRRRSSSPR